MSIVTDRKIINISQDLSTAANRNVKIDINVGFGAHEVIVRQMCYGTTEAGTTRLYQLYSDLIDDQILCSFPASTSTQTLDLRFPLNSFSKGQVNFQVQEVPNGTGVGSITTNAVGRYQVMLEFIRYKL